MKKRTPYKSVTLADVAREAKVSQTTVSRAINNPHLVDETTRRLIKEAMEKLGYVYSKNKTNQPEMRAELPLKGIVALMIPNDENPFYITLISIVENALERMGYLMMLCLFNNDASNIDSYLKKLMSHRVSGCIMAYIKLNEESAVFGEFKKTIPCVAFQSNISNVDLVESEEYSGTYSLLEQLVRYGHRKIGFVGYYSNISAYGDRFGAYQKIHEDYGIPMRPEYISEVEGLTGMDLQTCYREGCRLLSLPDRPTAIHCFNVKSAMGVFMAIRDYKLRIPEDISLSGFDDLQIAQLFTPPLSVAGGPLEAMVSAVVDFLIRRMEGNLANEQMVQHISFPSTTHIRGSIGPAPQESGEAEQ